jgi:hypothetical protein
MVITWGYGNTLMGVRMAPMNCLCFWAKGWPGWSARVIIGENSGSTLF